MKLLTREISTEEVVQYMNATKDKNEYRRWQVIKLVMEKMPFPTIAQTVVLSLVSVYATINRFNVNGAEVMKTKPRGGRVWSYLSYDKEKELLDTLVQDGTKGLIITAGIVQEKANAVVGKATSIFYAYDLLHRHHWRKIQPRPTHPKTNIEAQEEFKKNSQKQSKTV